MWSQSTVVRGKLSLGKERKWEDTRRTQFTHRGIFGGRGNSHIGDIWRQKHRAVCKEVDRLTEEKQRHRVRRQTPEEVTKKLKHILQTTDIDRKWRGK